MSVFPQPFHYTLLSFASLLGSRPSCHQNQQVFDRSQPERAKWMLVWSFSTRQAVRSDCVQLKGLALILIQWHWLVGKEGQGHRCQWTCCERHMVLLLGSQLLQLFLSLGIWLVANQHVQDGISILWGQDFWQRVCPLVV